VGGRERERGQYGGREGAKARGDQHTESQMYTMGVSCLSLNRRHWTTVWPGNELGLPGFTAIKHKVKWVVRDHRFYWRGCDQSNNCHVMLGVQLTRWLAEWSIIYCCPLEGPSLQVALCTIWLYTR